MLGNPRQRVALHLHSLDSSPSPINFQSTSSSHPSNPPTRTPTPPPPSPFSPHISCCAANTFIPSFAQCPKACEDVSTTVQSHAEAVMVNLSKQEAAVCYVCHLEEFTQFCVHEHLSLNKNQRQTFCSNTVCTDRVTTQGCYGIFCGPSQLRKCAPYASKLQQLCDTLKPKDD